MLPQAGQAFAPPKMRPQASHSNIALKGGDTLFLFDADAEPTRGLGVDSM